MTERENFEVHAFYFNFVTGEREKAIENCTLWAQSYPRELTAHTCLFFTREYLGRNEESLADGLECIRLEPDNGTCYGELVSVYGKLNRLSEAKMIYEQGLSRRLDHPFLHDSRYFIAFLEDDPEEMERQVNWAAGKTGTEDSLLADRSDTEAFFGRFAKARDLSRRVVESAVRRDQKDLVGLWQINGALREALIGNNGLARQQAASALSLASTQVSREQAAVVFALIGDSGQAEKLSQDLTNSFPDDTMQSNFWRPITLAASHISHNSPARALDELRAASPL